jgi:hypothetical protein
MHLIDFEDDTEDGPKRNTTRLLRFAQALKNRGCFDLLKRMWLSEPRKEKRTKALIHEKFKDAALSSGSLLSSRSLNGSVC